MLCSLWNSLCSSKQGFSALYNNYSDKDTVTSQKRGSACSWKVFPCVAFLGEDFKTVQKEVAEILKGRILVGHALQNDLKVH